MPDPYLAIEAVLPDDVKELLIQKVLVVNPQLEGANVSDILDMYYNADAMVDLSEPYWERHGEAMTREVPAHYISVALIAVALMRDHPREFEPLDVLMIQLLARRASDHDGATGHHVVDESARGGGSAQTEDEGLVQTSDEALVDGHGGADE